MITVKISGSKPSLMKLHAAICDSLIVDIAAHGDHILYPTPEERELLLFGDGEGIEYAFAPDASFYFMDCEYCEIDARIADIVPQYPELTFELSCVVYEGWVAFVDEYQNGVNTYSMHADFQTSDCWGVLEDEYPIQQEGIFDAVISPTPDSQNDYFVYREYNDGCIVAMADGYCSGNPIGKYHVPYRLYAA